MKKQLLAPAFLLISSLGIAQCSLTTIAADQTITCGDCVTLSAFGNGSGGNIAFQENFNSGSPIGWQFTQNVTIANNTCGVPSPDGSPFMWMGDDAVNPRDMETIGFDLTLGGTVCFEMRYSVQADATPCEGPDEPDEGVYLQYSTDNGATWVTIEYYDPNGGYDPALNAWNQYCATLPPGALTANTMIRWHQDDVSGAEFDHWGIDNVIITLNDPTFHITWLHDGYDYGFGSPGGDNPTPVCPQNTTMYTAQITNGVTTCTSDITITVVDPTIIIDAGNDTTVCPGDCAVISATAYELVSPASTPTFENSEVTPVFSGSAAMNINVQGLNAPTVTSGSITSICLNSFTFSGTLFCTTFGGCNCNGSPIAFGSTCNLDVSSFDITVTTPGGCQITLVPAGQASGTAYTDVCFVPAGGQSIALPSFPSPGNWNPQQPFSVLNGCASNGVWTMEVNAPGGLGFGAGFLNGWSITFDDPEITAPVNYTWTPVTDLTNSTTLSPTSCPSATTTYTLTATDTDGCTTVTDDVTITVGNCCALTIDNLAPVNPSCGASDGSITVTVSGQITGLEFSIDGGVTFQSSNVFSNLPAGDYTIQATDDNNCLETATITLTNANAPTINSITPTDASCGASDGTITINASGGSGTLQYSIDNGVTFVSGSVFNSLAAGNYDIVVEDAGGCQATGTTTIANANAPVINSITPTDASCGASDGTITINASGGSGTLQYSIDNGVTFVSGSVFNSLAAGNYDIVVEDAGGCQATGTTTIANANAPVINSITPTDASCGASDGTITINASGGSGTLQYSIDNGVTFVSGSTFNSLAAGNYNIVVEDAGGCQATGTTTIATLNGPVINSITPTDANCGASDGTIAINASGGSGTLQYSIDNGVTFVSGSTFNNLAAGNYDIVVEDAGGCQVTGNTTIANLNGPAVNAGPDQTVCTGQQVTLSGSGAGVVGYAWDNGVTNNTPFTPAATTTYTVTGTDANGCIATDQVTVTVNPGLIVNVTPSVTSGCSPLEVTFVNTTANSVNCTWEFSNGVNINGCGDQTVTFTGSGCYDLIFTATSASGCTGTATYNDIVCVAPTPTAAFSPTPNVLTIDNTISTMLNNSTNGTNYSWDFGDGSSNSSATSPTHTFPDTGPGTYTITLTVTNADGCIDVATGTVIIEEELIYFVPNAFTPDGDEFNQTFGPVFTSGFDPYDFNFQVYNRWGEIVFESNNHEIGWDGTYHGKLVQEGVYTWQIEFKTSKNDERKTIQGHLSVLE
ncbi:MAG: gliding motility-associated C-terminal domain-containing protein [Bacteroidota bacterium]